MQLLDEYKPHAKLRQDGYLFNAELKEIYIDTNRFNEKKKPTIPKDYKDWKLEDVDYQAYLNSRLDELDISEEENKIKLFPEGENTLAEAEVFTTNKWGDIEILQYSLDRQYYVGYNKQHDPEKREITKEYYKVQTRLHPLHVEMCGDKYDFTKGFNAPFWHKSLIEAYEEKKSIKTLIITEGQIKAFKACKDGIPTVGLTSINHFRDGKTREIHPEIIKFIKACDVKNIVILWDGDCRDISSKDLGEGNDISERPNRFLKNAVSIKKLLQQYLPAKHFNIYFSTILSDGLKDEPKGIDDLLVAYKGQTQPIVAGFHSIGEFPSNYFKIIDITQHKGEKHLNEFFGLDNVYNFNKLHRDLIGDKSFTFFGSTYKIDKTGSPVKQVDANLKKIIRVQNHYYKKVKKSFPVGDNEYRLEERLIEWSRANITQDHGKEAAQHIVRFDGFTNIPSHTNYKQVINNEYNLYCQLDHSPSEGEFPHINKLLKHIFDEHYDNEMIYDYFTLLWRQPLQKLPIIALVSEEQGTGKSTFVNLMKMIFKQNMADISNDDLISSFNSHWIDKLVVSCQETNLTRWETYEKLKSISTAKEYMRNEKNAAQGSIPCIAHLVLCSNHTNTFVKIDDNDTRFWLRKVPVLTEEINDFDEKLLEEIPHFIHFIESREIAYGPAKSRFYFHSSDYKTDQLKKLIQESEPGVIKNLRDELEDWFIKTGEPSSITMDLTKLIEEFGLKRGDRTYIKKSIKKYFKMDFEKNSSFHYMRPPLNGGDMIEVKGKGQFFRFHIEQFYRSHENFDPWQPPTLQTKEVEKLLEEKKEPELKFEGDD